MKLWVDPKMDALTRRWVEKEADLEVQGFFEVEVIDKSTLWCHSPILFEQVVAGASADSDGPGDTALMDFWDKQGKGWNETSLPYAHYGWWHSHGKMNTFLSGTDEATIRNIVSRGYLVSLVLNSKDDKFARVDTLVGSEELEMAMQVNFKVDSIEVVGTLSDVEKKEADLLYERLVTKKPISVTVGGRYAGYHGGSYGFGGTWRNGSWVRDDDDDKQKPGGVVLVDVVDYARSRDEDAAWVGSVEWNEAGVTFSEDKGGNEVHEVELPWENKALLKEATSRIGLPWRYVKRMGKVRGKFYTECESQGYRTEEWGIEKGVSNVAG